MILNTIGELKAYLGRAINMASTIDFIAPYIQLAQDEFILPAIGPEMLAELETQFNGSPSTLTAANTALIKRLQRALAFYTYVKYLPYSLGTDGDNGLQEQGTQNTQPVRMGVLDKRQRESADNAATALEASLQWMLMNKTQYPTWTASDSYKRARGLFIFNATELSMHLPQAGGSYRLFLSLMPYLYLAERNSILPVIGPDQFNDLKEKQLGSDALTPAYIRLADAVCRATATTAYAKALYHLNVVQTTGGGLRVLSDFDGIYNQKAADPKMLMQAQLKADTESSACLNALKSYLTTYADQYPLYKNSDYYERKGPNEFPENSEYKGIFRMR